METASGADHPRRHPARWAKSPNSPRAQQRLASLDPFFHRQNSVNHPRTALPLSSHRPCQLDRPSSRSCRARVRLAPRRGRSCLDLTLARGPTRMMLPVSFAIHAALWAGADDQEAESTCLEMSQAMKAPTTTECESTSLHLVFLPNRPHTTCPYPSHGDRQSDDACIWRMRMSTGHVLKRSLAAVQTRSRSAREQSVRVCMRDRRPRP